MTTAIQSNEQVLDRDQSHWSSIVLLSLAGMVTLAAVVLVALAMFQTEQQAEIVRKRVPTTGTEVYRLRTEQQEKISRYGWIDRPNGVLAIPIERAMSLVAEKL